MVNRRGANPTLKDNDGKNVLHYLASHNFIPDEYTNTKYHKADGSIDYDGYRKLYDERRKSYEMFVQFFIEKGCNAAQVRIMLFWLNYLWKSRPIFKYSR